MRSYLATNSVRALAAVAVMSIAAGPLTAQVQDNTLPTELRDVAFDQRLGASLPLDALFRDAEGVERPLGAFIGERPVILALVYYDCPMLCNLVLNGVVSSLRAVDFDAGAEFDVIAVSFDASEGTQLAAEKLDNYWRSYGREGTRDGWHFLTGDQASIDRLTQAAGFRYSFDEEAGEFAHSAGIMVATPSGKIARYFYGVAYPPRDLRLGLVEAADSKIGTLADQVMLYCFHYDPATGQYSLATLTAVRIGGVLTVLCMVAFMITMFRRERLEAATL